MNKFILTVFSLMAITIQANALIQDDFAQRTVTSFLYLKQILNIITMTLVLCQ